MPAPISQASESLLTSGGLATVFRSIPIDEAAGVLREYYGVSGTLKRLDTEKDDSFLVTTDRARFIAKFSNPTEDTQELSLQSEVLDFVFVSDATLPVPRVVRTVDGAAFFGYRDTHHQERLVRMLSYLEGTPLDSLESTAAERGKVGATLARLRLAMAGFAHAHDTRAIAWDVKHLPKLNFLLAHVQAAQRRRALEQGLDRFRALESRLNECRTQVLHNDLSRSNVVTDRSRPEFISGIIDFGDVVRTAIVIDLSTALLNQLSPNGDASMFDHGRELLRGYLEIADLTEGELLLLPHLVMSRLIARALITTWRAKQFPEKAAYIIRNTHQGWSQLDYFLSRSVDEVSATFLAAPARQSSTQMKEAFTP